MATARKFKTDGNRKGLIAKIKIGQKEIGWDDDLYRDVLEQRYGKTSSTQLTYPELEDLIDYMKEQGFKPKKSKKAPARAGTMKLAEGEEERKMRALWISLYHLGVVRDPAEAALVKFAARLSGKQRLQWLGGEDKVKVVEALKDWARREANVSWAPYYPLPKTPVHKPRFRVIEAQWKVLLQVSPNLSSNDDLKTHILERTVRGVPIADMTDEQADQAIENLGKYIREELQAQGFETLKEWKDAQP